MFQPTFQWHFQRPELYKHYFMVFAQQLRKISAMSGRDRWQVVCKQIDDARKQAEELETRGIALDMEKLSRAFGSLVDGRKGFWEGEGVELKRFPTENDLFRAVVASREFL